MADEDGHEEEYSQYPSEAETLMMAMLQGDDPDDQHTLTAQAQQMQDPNMHMWLDEDEDDESDAPDEEEDEDEAPPNPTTFAGGWPLPALRLQPMMAEPEPRTQAEGEMDEESLFHGIRKAKRGMEGAVPDKNAPPSDALAADGAALSPLGAGVLVTTCGHAVHLHCWQDYMSGLLRRVAAAESFEGEGQVRPQRGEFLCPVCRGLSNSVVPLCAREDRTTRGAPPDEAEVAKIASPEVEITSKAPAEAEAALGAAGGESVDRREPGVSRWDAWVRAAQRTSVGLEGDVQRSPLKEQTETFVTLVA